MSRYNTTKGYDTATAAATIRPGRSATRRGTLATWPATSCDTASAGPRHNTLLVAWAHHAHNHGLLGVHLCTQPSFGLRALLPHAHCFSHCLDSGLFFLIPFSTISPSFSHYSDFMCSVHHFLIAIQLFHTASSLASMAVVRDLKKNMWKPSHKQEHSYGIINNQNVGFAETYLNP